jgi:hypothetical protein
MELSKKFLLVSIVLIGAGLGVTLVNTPILRFAPGGPSQDFGNFTTTVQPNFPGGQVTALRGGALASGGITSLVGFGLVGVGLVLEAIAIFTLPSQSKETATS